MDTVIEVSLPYGSALAWPGGDSHVSDAREDSYHEMKEC